MNKRQEQIIFNTEGHGSCRHCGNTFGKREKRNFRVGFFVGDEFKTVLILINPTAFRCPFCFTRNLFQPFREEFVAPRVPDLLKTA